MVRGIIKPLPETVKSSVRSGVLVYDFTRVVEELIYNSLDAGATKVFVAVAVGTGYIKVTDNGCGITRDGLVLLGERYATSKFDLIGDKDTTAGSFGSRGEALGSISDVSLLEIVTKAHGRPNGYRKVMKGCKCLYLGIDDNRHDVGTTVTVHDLFYNQPVRRKQLQSSARKVLHILSECVLKIAIVHLKVNIKVFDIESEDELLSAHPSSSPLPLLKSGLGLDPSIMLHEFDVSDGILKISGYISGPGKTFPGKAVQYVYINSRFVWKGPIHKLLSQLAAKFDDIGTSNDFSGPGNGKRSRSQTNPSYILNLSCPSSLYDLTFEPSKTSAEFKDWDHILTFLEKAITNIWNKCMLNGHCLSDDALRNDNTWKEGINSVTTEDMESHYEKKRKRCEHQLYQAALEVPLHRKMLKESFNYMSPCSGNTFSGLKSSRTTSESEKNQEKISSTAQLCDGALSLFREAIDQENGCHLEAPVSKVYFAEDHLFENKVTAEISNEHMDSLMEAKCNMSHIDDDGITDMLAVSGSAHCFEASNDVEEISDTLNVNKYFLKGCSSRRGLSPGKAFSLSKGINFKSKGLESQEHCTDRACEVGVRVVVDSPIHESGKDERASVWCSPGFTNKDVMFMGPDTTTRAPMQLFQMVACFDEDTDLSLDLGNQFQKYGPRESSSKFGWSCVTPDSSAETKFMEADHVSNDAVQDKCKMNSYHYSGDKGCISGFDNMGYNFGHLNCFASSRIEDSGLGDYPSSQKDACDFRVDDVEYDFLPNVFDFHSDKVKGSCSKPVDRDKGRSDAASSSRVFLWNNEDANADGRSEIRGGEKAYGKRPRSHSAPPYYRGKKKFSILNSLSYTEALNAQVVSTHDASILKETYVVENNKQLSGVCRPSSNLYSVNGLINNMRPDMRRAGFNEAQDCETPTDFQNFHANMHSEGKSLETRDLPASKMKWRSSSQLSTSEENSNNLHNKDADILDISSGILHLAGDVLVPKVIEKDALRGAKVLQQVDRKYIPVVGGGVLAFIDQHAADERIRLEELRSKVLAGEMKTMTYLDVEQELVLPEFGHQLLQNYAELIRNWGWICSINTQSSRNFKKNLKLLHSQSSVATLIAVPCILGVNLTDGDLLEFLQQLSDTDGTSTVPPSVIRVLNFKACRGAIMFGDVLLPSECSLIVEELKQTSLCFQCAHGRPTTAPLVNLELLHEQILKLGLRGSSNELWQGLRRHEVSLKRAVQRLDAARDH
ncbi:DNA mismatch repair protein MLH3 isoform X1 [Daucus carota subsp. sativus]|uniref:DNA mismatch repair protein MLH3 isoform X1 n=2 Tax=Daucus carota subsp. sativus TaxID=79200 RepID=UPI0007F0186E|nr:PREDICTED: DNA mismatch repair protein MLH3 isoform X1 [Daucus carota subsp. sativus]